MAFGIWMAYSKRHFWLRQKRTGKTAADGRNGRSDKRGKKAPERGLYRDKQGCLLRMVYFFNASCRANGEERGVAH